MRNWRFSLTVSLVFVCSLAASGCQSTRDWLVSWRKPSALIPSESTKEEPTVAKLSAAQRADMQFTLARLSESRGETEAAIQAYRATLQEDPQRHDAAWRLAVIYDRQGKSGLAEPLFRQALQGASQNADLHSDFGYSLSLQSRWQESEEQLRRAIALNPQHARAHNNLGVVLASNRRIDEAAREFELAGCEPSVCLSNLAYGLALSGHIDEARQYYQQALALDPQLPAAQRGLRQIESASAAMAKHTASSESVVRASNWESPQNERTALRSNSPSADATRLR